MYRVPKTSASFGAPFQLQILTILKGNAANELVCAFEGTIMGPSRKPLTSSNFGIKIGGTNKARWFVAPP